MPLFIGEYLYTIDEKGRVNIPARFRKATAEHADNTYIISQGRDKCLYIYPMDIYEKKIVEMMDKLSEADPLHRAFMSLQGAKATDASLDKQGRITIPPKFVEFAGIQKDVQIIGAFNRIEVWDPKIRENYLHELDSSGIDLEEKISLELSQ
ncbi:MAG TPA: division/cell wall cluster transcriptional repressor MraZ [bacterium]|jgi:MraZ protein